MSLHSSPRPGRGFDRKTMQLCKHVERTLNQVLSGECDDNVLRELMVVDVVPLDGAAQLLVIVQPFDREKPPETAVILKKLHAVKGKLRFAIGESISRRKVPDLCFKIAGPAYEWALQVEAAAHPMPTAEDSDDLEDSLQDEAGDDSEEGVEHHLASSSEADSDSDK